MPNDDSPRRRDVLRTGAAAGLLGLAGVSVDGAFARTAAQNGAGVFSYSLQESDLFRVRFRPRTPDGTPVTESVPAGCLDGEQAEEYQLYIVDAYRDGENTGYRGLLAPREAVVTERLGTTTADGDAPGTEMETETEAAMQDETTTAEEEETTARVEETTAANGEPAGDELPTLVLGEWYRVSSAEACDGLYRLSLETAEAPETNS